MSREMTEAEIWEEVYKERDQYHAECARVNNRIFKALTKVKGSQYVHNLHELMEWAEARGTIQIAKRATGNKNKEDFGKIKTIWVDQWSVGMEGDSWAGYIYVRIKKDQYLKIYYEC
jgi:hypothetical protein